MTAAEVFADIASRLQNRPDKLAGLSAVYQFDLTGEEAGTWQLKIKDGRAEVHQGAVDPASTTLVASSSDWLQIATGKLDPTMAFMQGKLKVKGDMPLAMKLQGLMR
jgi:putative sterol carrier protein